MTDEVEKVERKLRCPRCMGDGKHYQELALGELRLIDDDPCPDCKGEGEGNVDAFLSLYMQRAQGWKMKADNAEGILKRVLHKKGPEALMGIADDQRLLRIEKAARELVRDLRQEDEPPEGLAPLEWALMGGDPDDGKVD
jgi:hypothetical protein